MSIVLFALYCHGEYTKAVIFLWIQRKMLKRVVLWILWWLLCFSSVGALEFWPWDETILTNTTDDVVSGDISASDDVVNAGIDAIGGGQIDGIYGETIADNATAWEKATNLMKWFMNYLLWLVGLIALGYLIVNGFITLTAGDNEERSARWMKWIRVAALAIAWLALSWFLLSLIFFLIFTVTDGL